MTNTTNFDTIEPTNPVLTVAPSKEETEMLGATEKVTALYCRLSQEDERMGESLSIENQDKICQGGFLQKSTRSQKRYTYIQHDNVISVVKLKATVILSTTVAFFKIAFYILCKQ